MQNSLRFRLIIILIILAIGPLLLAGGIISQRSFSFERRQAYDLQNQVAQNVSTEVETFFLGINNDLVSLGNEIRSLENPDQAQQLSLMLSAISSGTYRNVYNELTLLGDNGQEIVRLSPEEIIPNDMLIDRSQQEEFKQPATTRATYYSPVTLDQNTGKAFITIAIPLYEPRSTNLIGVLVANIRLESVGNTISRVQVGENQTVYLTDSNGVLLAHQDRAADINNKQIQLPKSAATQKGLDGDDVILTSDKIQLGDQSLYIVAEKPTSVALGLAYATTNTITVVVILALVAASALGYFAVRQIVVPIEGLASVAEQVAAGDLSQKVQIKRRDEIGVLAIAFNSMTSQLLDLIGGLEQRVKDRTTELAKANERIERRAVQFETIAHVARIISSTRDLNILLSQITTVISREFGFYHVGVFLLDAAKEFAVLSAANSAGGQVMLGRGHRLKVGQVGIVGYVTGTGEPRVALDTGTDAVFFDNPDLPNTHSEIALPLRAGEEIIGALDVQSTEANAFSQEDINILSSLADQVSIAIQNAQQFEETRKALKESDVLSRQFAQTGWQQFTKNRKLAGVLHTGAKSSLLYMNDGKDGGEQGSSSTGQLKAKERGTILSLPIKLRGEVIGSVDVRAPENRQWDQDEMDIVTAIIERAALAMENARLLEESQKLAAKERTIGDISTKISASINLKNILQTAVEELGRAMPGSEVIIDFEQKNRGAE